MTKTITIKKAQEDLLALVKNVREKQNRYLITINGVPYAHIIPAKEEDYPSGSETAEILADKKLMRDIKIAEKELEEGKYVTLDQLKKDLDL